MCQWAASLAEDQKYFCFFFLVGLILGSAFDPGFGLILGCAEIRFSNRAPSVVESWKPAAKCDAGVIGVMLPALLSHSQHAHLSQLHAKGTMTPQPQRVHLIPDYFLHASNMKLWEAVEKSANRLFPLWWNALDTSIYLTCNAVIKKEWSHHE